MNQKEKNHDDAVHRKQLIVCFRFHEIALGCQQLKAYQDSKGATKKKEKRDGDQKQQGDAFVVLCQQPRPHAVTAVEVVLAIKPDGFAAHSAPSGVKDRM